MMELPDIVIVVEQQEEHQLLVFLFGAGLDLVPT